MYISISSWRRTWQPTPVLLPGESHGQSNLVGYSPWGHKELDTTQWLTHYILCMIYRLVAKLCPTLSTAWTVARQAPLSMGFSRQEYWSGLPCPSPGDLPHPGIEPRCPALQADYLLTEPPRRPIYDTWCISYVLRRVYKMYTLQSGRSGNWWGPLAT